MFSKRQNLNTCEKSEPLFVLPLSKLESEETKKKSKHWRKWATLKTQ